MVPAAWIYSIQFGFWPPELHQHLHLHLTYHLGSRTYPLTSDLHWHQYLHLYDLYWLQDSSKKLQLNDFITFYMLTFIPLHFLCTHLWQLVHCIELLPTPLPHTPHGHLAAFCQARLKNANFTYLAVKKCQLANLDANRDWLIVTVLQAMACISWQF